MLVILTLQLHVSLHVSALHCFEIEPLSQSLLQRAVTSAFAILGVGDAHLQLMGEIVRALMKRLQPRGQRGAEGDKY